MSFVHLESLPTSQSKFYGVNTYSISVPIHYSLNVTFLYISNNIPPICLTLHHLDRQIPCGIWLYTGILVLILRCLCLVQVLQEIGKQFFPYILPTWWISSFVQQKESKDIAIFLWCWRMPTEIFALKSISEVRLLIKDWGHEAV
jgi:hypothetical protein